MLNCLSFSLHPHPPPRIWSQNGAPSSLTSLDPLSRGGGQTPGRDRSIQGSSAPSPDERGGNSVTATAGQAPQRTPHVHKRPQTLLPPPVSSTLLFSSSLLPPPRQSQGPAELSDPGAALLRSNRSTPPPPAGRPQRGRS